MAVRPCSRPDRPGQVPFSVLVVGLGLLSSVAAAQAPQPDVGLDPAAGLPELVAWAESANPALVAAEQGEKFAIPQR